MLNRKHTINARWKGEMQFETEINGHAITVDATEKHGGKNQGPTPKSLLLSALACCTGMDVVSILKTNQVKLNDMKIKVTGELEGKRTTQYGAAHIIYLIRAADKDKDAILKAIFFSQEKLCGVAKMLRKAMPISWEVVLNGEDSYDNSID